MWQSVHIHYVEQDDLIIEMLPGLLKELRSDNLIDRAFFIRHWQGGPHIRLRVEPKSRDCEAIVLSRMLSAVRDYVTKHPSSLNIDPDLYNSAAEAFVKLEGDDAIHELIANNSVNAVRYDPEYLKYAGSDGVDIAESLADFSTQLVVEALPGIRSDRAKRLAWACRMTIVGASAAGLAGQSLVNFLSTYCAIWSRWLPGDAKTRWQPISARNESSLPHELGSAAASPAEPTLLRWAEAVRQAITSVRRVDGVNVTQKRYESTTQYLLTNYLHTNNNRLGVLPGEEAFLAYRALLAIRRQEGRTE
jgi:hypothetical protein